MNIISDSSGEDDVPNENTGIRNRRIRRNTRLVTDQIPIVPINIEPYFDTTFQELFIDPNSGDLLEYQNLDEVSRIVETYEEITGIRLFVIRVSPTRRTYGCRYHANCTFRANIGRIIGSTLYVLKESNLYHRSRN